jgi:hypothetical protein
MPISAAGEFLNERFELETGGKNRSARDFNEHCRIYYRDQQWRGAIPRVHLMWLRGERH